jgi:hypothetical protein
MKTGLGLRAFYLLITTFLPSINADGIDTGGPPDSGGATPAGPVYLGNFAAAFDTNGAVTVRLRVVGGTSGWLYDVFGTTNVTGDPHWTRLAAGRSGDTAVLGNQPAAGTFYVLGTPRDSDADGLTDAFEQLISRSHPSNPDTDGDGWTDYYEWFVSGTSPRAQDTDGDGVIDQPLKVLITQPRNNSILP